MFIIHAYTLYCPDTSSQLSQLEFPQSLLHPLQALYPSPSSSEQQATPSDSIRSPDSYCQHLKTVGAVAYISASVEVTVSTLSIFVLPVPSICASTHILGCIMSSEYRQPIAIADMY